MSDTPLVHLNAKEAAIARANGRTIYTFQRQELSTLDWNKPPVVNPPASSPSGFSAPPVASGFVRTFDDFDGTSLTPVWGQPYDGRSGARYSGRFVGTHTSVADSVVTLAAYPDPVVNNPALNNWGGAGISTVKEFTPPYQILCAIRQDPHPFLSGIALMYHADSSTDEIDFVETSPTDNTITSFYATVHFGNGHQAQEEITGIDLTKWCVFGVNVTATTIEYLYQSSPTAPLKVWKSIPNPGFKAPSCFDLQIQTGDPVQAPPADSTVTASNPVKFQCDWVAIDLPG